MNNNAAIHQTKNTVFSIAVPVFVFSAIFIFFAKAHPIIPWDGDDWRTLTIYNHRGFPTWGTWNPSRIFPEVFGPLAGYFAAFVVYPLHGDYIYSITLTVALLIACCVTGVYYFLYRLLYALTSKQYLAATASLLFIILCFLLFKSKDENNYFMFWAYNLCTVFYYMLPNLLNSMLVLYFMSRSAKGFNTTSDFTIVKSSIFILILYFAVFSMLWGCAVLAVFIFFNVIIDKPYHNNWIKTILLRFSRNKLYAYILILFFIYCLFEFFGGRSARLQQELPAESFFINLRDSFKQFVKLALQMKKIFLLFAFTVFAAGCIIRIITKDSKNKIWRLITLSGLCTISLAVFYIVVAAKARPNFSSRIESVYGVYFFGLLSVTLSSVYIIEKYFKAFLVFPLVCAVLFVETTSSVKPYSESQYTDTSALQRYETMKSWIGLIQSADREGKTKLVIPYKNIEIWFYDMSAILNRHNIISQKMEIVFEKEI